ncbi:hypothetical protein DL768_003934 [Monosporascus sp. mg162]|nr:hypothetical protein DL768_003934 [Monosporascus sp. mg162]
MSSTTIQYEALAQQIESILKDPRAITTQIKDEKIRRRLAAGGRKLGISLEEPRDTLRRFGYMHFQLPLALVGVETGLFAALAAEPRSFTSAELAEKTGVNLSLLKRLLRYYQALDMISQIENDTWQSSNVTQILSNDYHANVLRFSQKITAPASLSLPEWLQSNGYKDPTGLTPTAWGSAFHTDQHPYSWLADNPWALELALAHMRIQREGRPLFFDALDFEKRFAQDTTSSTVLFVDIGGSTGSQSLTFRQRYPSLPGRVIVQDRPEIVQRAKATLASSANIEAEEYDIFTPEPVKGMTDQSVVMIDETVLSERGAAPRGAQHDMEVMLCVGAKERTKAEWEKLLEDAGLKLREVVKYDEEYEDCLIIAGLK